mgnify:CR=1 FL=1
MYLTYEEYEQMGGELDEPAFNEYEFEAESYVDWYTFNRLQNETDIPLTVKRLIFKIVKRVTQQAALSGLTSNSDNSELGGAAIASRSNDGVSESYNIISASELLQNSKAAINEDIKRYLNGVSNSLGRKLLYRGLYPGE